MSRMDAARFAAGQTFTDFVVSAVQLKELWDNAVKRATPLDDAAAALREVRGTWHLVALNEDWCLDAVSSVTPIAALVDLTSNVDLRILGRDANPDLMDAHLSNGSRSIPVIIAYDEGWIERAWWGPRPAELQEWVAVNGKIVERDEKYRHIRGWYARDKGVTIQHEIVAMLQAASGQATTTSSVIHVIAPNTKP